MDEALKRFAVACHLEAKAIHWQLRQPRLAARLMRNESLAEVAKSIAYLDAVGEHGSCSEANALYGLPGITLDE